MKMYLVIFDGYYGGYGSEFYILGLYPSTADADAAICQTIEEMHVERRIFRVIELEEGKTYQTGHRKRDEEYYSEKYIGGYTE